MSYFSGGNGRLRIDTIKRLLDTGSYHSHNGGFADSKAAFELLQKAFLPLLDTAADAETMDTVTEVLEDLKGEFIEYHDLRSRKAGRDVHIDMHLVVQAEMSIEEAHDLCDTIESRIQERLNYSHVLIHVEPE